MESTFQTHPKVTPAVVQIAFIAPNASIIGNFSDLLVENSLHWVADMQLGGVFALNPVGLK
jgi:hypothetical protein